MVGSVLSLCTPCEVFLLSRPWEARVLVGGRQGLVGRFAGPKGGNSYSKISEWKVLRASVPAWHVTASPGCCLWPSSHMQDTV